MENKNEVIFYTEEERKQLEEKRKIQNQSDDEFDKKSPSEFAYSQDAASATGMYD